jgi:hypothetical protein
MFIFKLFKVFIVICKKKYLFLGKAGGGGGGELSFHLKKILNVRFVFHFYFH